MLFDRNRPHRHHRVHIHIQKGRFRILGVGRWYSYWKDPYYLMLTVPWTGFFAITIGMYALANAIAAILFLLGGEGTILNANSSSWAGAFADAFFFSVQTSASIGYGVMSPGTTYAHLLVTLEAIIALLGISVLTGLAYARFSRPTAQVLFSKMAVVSPFRDQPTLMFRAANERRNQILEAQMRVYITLDEFDEQGKMMRRYYELDLLRDRNPSFFLTWTAFHPITPNSPLYGLSQSDLHQKSAAIIVSVSGIDQTVAQAVHTRHTYYSADILWNHTFKDIIHSVDKEESDDDDLAIRYIDFEDFHEVEPTAEKEVEAAYSNDLVGERTN